ncbi:contactin-associated protein like 5-3 isoform X6, partial [Sigmodon hispidus]
MTAKPVSAASRPLLCWAAFWMTSTGTRFSWSGWASRQTLLWTPTRSTSGPRVRLMSWTLTM